MKQSRFFDKINTIDKPLVKLTNRQRERLYKLTKLEMKGGDITNNTEEIQRIKRISFKDLYTTKLDYFLIRYHLIKVESKLDKQLKLTYNQL